MRFAAQLRQHGGVVATVTQPPGKLRQSLDLGPRALQICFEKAGGESRVQFSHGI